MNFYSLKATIYCIGQRLNVLLHQFQYSVILHLTLHALWKPNFKIKTNALQLVVSNFGKACMHCGVRRLPKQSGKIILHLTKKNVRFSTKSTIMYPNSSQLQLSTLQTLFLFEYDELKS